MMSAEKKELPADIKKFRDSYVEMFGTLPPLPAARFEFSGDVNPEFLRVSEQLRKGAFYSDALAPLLAEAFPAADLAALNAASGPRLFVAAT